MLRKMADADRSGYVMDLGVDLKRKRDDVQHVLGYRRGPLPADVWEHDDKLIPAQASDQILVAHAVFEPFANFLQKPVADAMSVQVVDRLEAVKVNEHESAANRIAT